MELLKEHIEQFINYTKIEKRLSAHTVKAYDNDMSSFYEFVSSYKELDNLEEINTGIIRGWMVSLKDLGNSNRTIHRKISALKSFYKFLLKHEIVAIDYTENIVIPKSEKKLPTFFSNKQLDQLLEIMKKNQSGFQTTRDYLIINLLYSTGIRQSELIELKENNISSEFIKVLGKRNKERLVPITQELYQLILDYQKQKSDNNFKTIELLVTDNGKKMYPKFVYRVVNKYINVVSTEQKKSPHPLMGLVDQSYLI